VSVFSRERYREPVYGGKKLSEWVSEYAANSMNDMKPAPTQGAVDAIRHIGTNALPFLLKWIRYEPPLWKLKLNRVLNPIMGRPTWLDTGADNVRSAGATYALIDLSGDAEGLVEGISRLANDNMASESRTRAVIVLGGLGKAGLPALVGVLTNEQARAVTWSPVSVFSATFIGANGHLEPNIARGAIPALLHMLKSPHVSIRSSATNALRQIDPQALENRGAE